jgi:hypothetical protein
MEYSSKAKVPGRQRSQLRHGEPSAEGLSSLALVIGAERETSTGDGVAEGSSNVSVPPRPSNVAERGPTARSFQPQAISPTWSEAGGSAPCTITAMRSDGPMTVPSRLGVGPCAGCCAGVSIAGASTATGGGRRDGEKSGRSRVADRLANGIAATGLPLPSAGPACVRNVDSTARQSDRATTGAVFTGQDATTRSRPARRAGANPRPRRAVREIGDGGERHRRRRESDQDFDDGKPAIVFSRH